MKKYEVIFKTEVYMTVTVEAKNEDEAIELAQDKVDFGLTSYCGNGGCDQLVGVNDEDISLSPSEYVEFDGIEEI